MCTEGEGTHVEEAAMKLSASNWLRKGEVSERASKHTTGSQYISKIIHEGAW